ncbi:MAG: hypothetical protein ACLVL2_29205 [Bacteroides cellulosilyticus]
MSYAHWADARLLRWIRPMNSKLFSTVQDSTQSVDDIPRAGQLKQRKRGVEMDGTSIIEVFIGLAGAQGRARHLTPEGMCGF